MKLGQASEKPNGKGAPETEKKPLPDPIPGKSLRAIPLKAIRVAHETNVRKRIYQSDVNALRGSIARVGQIHPSVVRPLSEAERAIGVKGPDGKLILSDEQFKLVAGEQRYFARWAEGVEETKDPADPGKMTLECIVWEGMTERLEEEVNLDENTFRTDLNLYDIMQRCLRRREKWGETVDEMAERTDISDIDIRRFFRIADRVAPELIDRLRVDARAQTLDRLDQASRIQGINAYDRFERQRKWWANEGWNQNDSKRASRSRAQRTKIARTRRAAEVIELTQQIETPEGTITFSMQQARAVAMALRWSLDPLDYPCPYKDG